MADNVILPGIGTVVRTLDQGLGTEKQVMALDFGGETGPEAIVTTATPLPVLDNATATAKGQDAPLFTALVGDPNGDFAGVNLLEELMNDGSGFALNVKTINSPAKLDANGAAVMSDAPTPIVMISSGVSSVFVIDTTGYQTLSITSDTTFSGSTQGSNDGKNYGNLYGVILQITTGAGNITGISANSTMIFPCLTRYIKISSSAAGTATAYLRSQPFSPGYNQAATVGISQLGGGSISGTAGLMPVCGSTAAGNSSVAGNPVQLGGADPTNIVRKVLVDTTGRLQSSVYGTDTTGTLRQIPVTVGQTSNTSFVPIQDITQFEGQNNSELLAQILLELKIMNQQLFALPQILNQGLGPTDEPASFRQDPAFFSQ